MCRRISVLIEAYDICSCSYIRETIQILQPRIGFNQTLNELRHDICSKKYIYQILNALCIVCHIEWQAYLRIISDNAEKEKHI